VQGEADFRPAPSAADRASEQIDDIPQPTRLILAGYAGRDLDAQRSQTQATAQQVT
jgi:hypothetical protein